MTNIPFQINQFPFKPFTPKDIQVLSWWLNPKYKNKETIICDGSVRSGKTLVMSISFIEYTMHYFNNVDQIFLGDSVSALYRNVINRLIWIFQARGYTVTDNHSAHVITFEYGGKRNFYHLFGANNSKSADHIRGLTAGCMFADEVAEMPQETVRVATERCNFDKSTFWFNCNPAGPYNWFKREWIDKPKKHHILHIPFRLEDNPALSQHVIDRYKRSYSGVAYQRDILGKWVMASGLIYSNFDKHTMIKNPPNKASISKYIISCDYGAQNPTVFLLWGYVQYTNSWYILKEYFYDARHTAGTKTDEDYANDLDAWLDQYQRNLRPPIIVDPAAQNFVETLLRRHYNVLNTNKDVLNGIRLTQIRMNQHRFYFTPNLPHVFQEIYSYIWDKKAEDRGVDKVVKSHDHFMDAMRYFVVDFMPATNNQTGNSLQLFKNQF